jgi:hypothetical protein
MGQLPLGRLSSEQAADALGDLLNAARRFHGLQQAYDAVKADQGSGLFAVDLESVANHRLVVIGPSPAQ